MTRQSSTRAHVLGALLAGGKSRRMGRDKASVITDDVTGETLGSRAVRALRAVSDEVVVLGHGRGVHEALARIEDPVVDAGPLGGLLGLLRTRSADLFVIVAIDMPDVGAPELSVLREALHETQGACAAVFAHRESPRLHEPLPLALTPLARGRVEAAFERGERRLGALVDELEPVRVLWPHGHTPQNINTIEDLQRWSGSGRHR